MIRKFIATFVALVMVFSLGIPQFIASAETTLKPDDYSRVLYFQDFENLENFPPEKEFNQKNILKPDSLVEGIGEHGDYINILGDPDAPNGGTDMYFRMKYDGDSSNTNNPIYSTGITRAELEAADKFQVTVDLCPQGAKYNFAIYDREASASSTTNQTMLTFGAASLNEETGVEEGTLSIYDYSTGTAATQSTTYTKGEWMTIDLYFDFSSGVNTVDAYINGELWQAGLGTKEFLCIESFGMSGGPTVTTATGMYFDNLRVATLDTIRITESTPSDDATNVTPTDTITFKISNQITNFADNMVEVTADEEPVEIDDVDYNQETGVVTVLLADTMEYSMAYEVILKAGLTDVYGQTGAECKFDFGTCMEIIDDEEEDIVNPGPEPEPEPELPPMDTTTFVDYNRVVFEEKFDGMEVLQPERDFQFKNLPANYLVRTETERGDYINVKYDGSDNAYFKQTGSFYFRIKYDSDESKYGIFKSGVTRDEMKQIQLSVDLCPMGGGPSTWTVLDAPKNASTGNHSPIGTHNIFKIHAAESGTGVLTFYESGTGNEVGNYPYTPGEWFTLDIFFDLRDTQGKFNAYINGTQIVSGANTSIPCLESFGISSVADAQATGMGFDNLRVAIPYVFNVESVSSANESVGFSVLDDVKITFTNPVKDPVSSQVTIKCEGETISTSDYELVANGNDLYVKFDEPKEFGSEYTVTVENFMRDAYGNLLGEDYTFSFTTMEEQIVATTPEIGETVTGDVFNPTTETIDMVLVVTIVNPDGSSEVYTDTITLGAGEVADLTVDELPELEEGQKIYSYISNDPETFKPMKNAIATDGEAISTEGTEAVTATVEKANILGNTVEVEGKISAEREELVLITVAKITDAPALFSMRAASETTSEIVSVIPVLTEEDGTFSHEFIVDGMEEGRYSVSVTGYNVTESSEQGYVYLDADTKAEILAAVNDADSVAEMEEVFELYEDQLFLDDYLYNDNTYLAIFQQADYDEYDDFVTMIYTADTALNCINDYDWLKYESIYEDYGYLVLKEADEKDAYDSYSESARNKINKVIVKSKPFATFSEFAKAFDKAVDDYDEDGGSNGSGRSDKGAENFSFSVAPSVTPAQPVLFADMADVAWASAHVQQLYARGIVSAAANYRPHDSITREEFVKMLVVLSGVAVEGTADFADVNGNEWFAPYLAAAKTAGIVKGNDDGTFGVGRNITRQEMVTMASRAVVAMGKTLKFTKEAQTFADASSISDYAADAVSEMQRAGVVSGVGDGSFQPAGLASRAQAAVVVANLINAIQ